MDLKSWRNKRLHIEEPRPLQKALEYTPSTRDLLNLQVNLHKAIKEEDWDNLVDNGHDESLSSSADPSGHQSQHPLGQDFTTFINDPTPYPNLVNPYDTGLSVKSINKTPQGTFMMKPYFEGTMRESTNPFSGFSAMTAKSMFNAGGLNSLVEDISTGNHKGVPITFHKFADDYDDLKDVRGTKVSFEGNDSVTMPAGDFEHEILDSAQIHQGILHHMDEAYSNPYNINPMQAKQIGIMDYLLGNRDRHGGNIKISRDADQNGFKNLLAIDHDRLFDYNNDNFAEQFTNRAFGEHGFQINIHKPEDHDTEVVSWWEKNRSGLLKALHENTKNIKNPVEKSFITESFFNRMEVIDDYTKKYRSAQESGSIRPSMNSIANHAPSSKMRIHGPKMDQLNTALPADPSEAIGSLSDFMSEASNWEDGVQESFSHTFEAVKQRLASASSESVVSLISRTYSDKNAESLKRKIIKEIYNGEDDNLKHVQAILEVDNSLPDGQKFLTPALRMYAKDLAG